MAEAVSGQTWDELVTEIYNEPCGLDSLGYISASAVDASFGGYPIAFGGDPANAHPSENPNIEGGAYVSVPDYGQLLLMHLRGGVCGDTQVLSPEALRHDVRRPGGRRLRRRRHRARIGYGMGWWIDRETGQLSDPGLWGAVAWLDLDDRYGAYLIVEDEGATGQSLKTQIEDFVHEGVVGA